MILIWIFFIIVANWGLPLAAIADAQDNPEKISGKMTTGEYILYRLCYVQTVAVID